MLIASYANAINRKAYARAYDYWESSSTLPTSPELRSKKEPPVSNPYLFSALFYLFITLLMAFDLALVNWGVLPGYSGIPWLRVHFITLGFVSQAVFGALPRLQAVRHRAPISKPRLDIWGLLNAGIVALLMGVPIVNKALILAGGTLIFIAAIMLALQLREIAHAGQASGQKDWPRRFYGVGVLFLLVGVLIGTGYWLGWSAPLHIASPIEAHVHANNWGFLSMVFAGMLITLAPDLLGRPLAAETTLGIIFGGMVLGALGLVSGPWWGGPRSIPVSVAGLVIHMVVTVVLVVVTWQAFRAAGKLDVKAWHLLLAYLWFIMPMLMAPIVVFHLGSISGERIEGTAPQALIYGWAMQFGLAMVPYFLDRYLLKKDHPQLGGTMGSLLLVNVGAALIWVGIFLEPYDAALWGVAYALLGLAALLVAGKSYRTMATVP